MAEIGFIGIGNMGLPLASRLLDGGEKLVVHDLRDAAVEPLLQRQARRAGDLGSLADSCSTIVVSLPSLESMRAVVLGEAGLASGRAVRTIVNTSTIGVPLAQEIAQALGEKGISLVDCPVSGGPAGARAGKLSVMVSGDPKLVEALRPMISQWGVMTIAGDKPGMAQLLKLTNNILSAVAVVATSEAFIMGAKGGLDPEVMIAAINAGSGRNSMTLNKIPDYVLGRTFDFGSPIHLLMKDVDLAIASGEALGIPMWVCQAARLVFKHATFLGMKDRDVTEMVKVIEQGAGFELPKTR